MTIYKVQSKDKLAPKGARGAHEWKDHREYDGLGDARVWFRHAVADYRNYYWRIIKIIEEVIDHTE